MWRWGTSGNGRESTTSRNGVLSGLDILLLLRGIHGYKLGVLGRLESDIGGTYARHEGFG